MIDYLLECRICHEDCAYLETEGNRFTYVACANCGSQTVAFEYKNEEEKKEAEIKVMTLWNMGKVIAERRGE